MFCCKVGVPIKAHLTLAALKKYVKTPFFLFCVIITFFGVWTIVKSNHNVNIVVKPSLKQLQKNNSKGPY